MATSNHRQWLLVMLCRLWCHLLLNEKEKEEKSFFSPFEIHSVCALCVYYSWLDKGWWLLITLICCLFFALSAGRKTTDQWQHIQVNNLHEWMDHMVTMVTLMMMMVFSPSSTPRPKTAVDQSNLWISRTPKSNTMEVWHHPLHHSDITAASVHG